MLARTAPEGLVVAVASTDAANRAGSIRSVLARTIAPWLSAVSALWALITKASAPAASACGGRSGWKPKCPAQAASTTSGTPCRWAVAARAPVSPYVPTYCGSVTRTATADGASASAPATTSALTASGSPVRGSTEGVTQVGTRSARTSPRSIERCRVRPTTTRSPGRPTVRARAWLPWVDPPTEKRATSAPQARAASSSAWSSTPELSFIVSRPAYRGMSPSTSGPSRSRRCLCPGMVNGCKVAAANRRKASKSGASARSPRGSRVGSRTGTPFVHARRVGQLFRSLRDSPMDRRMVT